MQNFRVIYIYGPDGSGKSTICRELVRILEKNGIKATHRWMRFNHYISKVINALGHLTGLSYYVTYPNGTKIGYHDYHKSRLIRIVYYLATIWDAYLATLFKLWIPLLINRKVIILDRFIFDIIADLSIDARNPDLLSSWLEKLFKMLLPSKTVSIYIDTDKEVIFNRRPDTQWDKNFPQRMELYKKIHKTNSISYKVNNNGELDAALKTIINILKRDEKERNPVTV
jgi:thymidylate kinase